MSGYTKCVPTCPLLEKPDRFALRIFLSLRPRLVVIRSGSQSAQIKESQADSEGLLVNS